MKEIKKYQSRVDAELDKSFLESNGIPCFVAHDDMGGLRPDFPLTGFASRLFILKEEDEEVARALLEGDGKA